jgi:hypothetical protein
MGQQTGDGLHGVTHVLAAAEVAGQRPPVLQMGDAVFDLEFGAFYLNLRCGGVTTCPPVCAPRP